MSDDDSYGGSSGGKVPHSTVVLPRGLSPLFWVAVLLPLLGYVASIGIAEAKRWGAPTIEVAIEGYDPRDPFRGQYLRYTIAVAQRVGTHSYMGQACAAPAKDGVSPVVVYDGTLDVDCEHPLPVDFVEGQHRFYIQQDKARGLEKAVQEGRATVRLRLISATEVTVDELLVDRRTP